MTTVTTIVAGEAGTLAGIPGAETTASAVSWPAVFAGAVAAAALSLVLILIALLT